MKLPGQLRQGFIQEINRVGGIIKLTDGKGSYKEVTFHFDGRGKLAVGRKDKHLLLLGNKYSRRAAQATESTLGDRVVCLISNGKHPPHAYTWATVKDHRDVINLWQEIRYGQKLKQEFRERVTRFRDTEAVN